jgi:hypothetical protein
MWKHPRFTVANGDRFFFKENDKKLCDGLECLHIIDRSAGASLFVTANYQPIKFIKRLVRKASSLYLPTKKREFYQRKKTKRREKNGKAGQ